VLSGPPQKAAATKAKKQPKWGHEAASTPGNSRTAQAKSACGASTIITASRDCIEQASRPS
jgi:hypothetical protein